MSLYAVNRPSLEVTDLCICSRQAFVSQCVQKKHLVLLHVAAI